MKKFVLFILAAMVVSISFGQSQMAKKNNYIPKVSDEEYTPKNWNLPVPELNTKAVNEDVNRIVVGKAANQRILRREEIKGISYNAELDVISVSLVLDPATYPEADEAGIVAHIYSTDHGQTWSAPVVVNDYTDEGANYYISGGLYNPAGNTDVMGLFGIHQGTVNPNDGVWNHKAFGTANFAGEYLTTELTTGATEDDGYWNIHGLTQVGEEMRCMNMSPEGAWGGYTGINFEPIVGEFDGEEFEWDFQDLVEVELIEDVTNEGAYWQGRWQGYDAATEMAWSEDGEIGYMWILGISEEEFSGVQPQVYRTEDGGDSWDFIYLDFQDDAVQAMIEPFVIETSAGYMVPAFFESDGVVNANGELEIFGAIGAHSSDIFNYPDSIGYQWVYPGDIANVTVGADGIENVMWVDSLLTENVLADTEGNYAGSGWQHRIHAARNNDGTQVFVTWAETRDPEAEYNLSPDLYGWSKGVCDNPIEMDAVCFTEGTLYETFYYFHSSSHLVYDNGNGYTMPTIQGITPAEFSTNTSAAADPITINYITGIEFDNLCPTGVAELEGFNNLNVTQNQPNPFTGTTTIEISSNTVAPVSVEVTNIMGQTVYAVNEGTINGTMNVTIDASNLEAGVYFYTVTVGNESVSKKMIVE